jgi:multidrug efflux pump subunit AcrB
MLGSYILSSTFVPVLSTWILKHSEQRESAFVTRFRARYEQTLRRLLGNRGKLIACYLAISALTIVLVGGRLGMDIFPVVDSGEFRLRLRAPDGTHFERTERLALDVLKVIEDKVGPDRIAMTLGYVGTIPSTYPINAVYQWSRGPEEAILRVALKPGSKIKIEDLKEELRRDLAKRMPQLRLSFEPADIVNEVMCFGSPTPIDIAVSGPNLAENRAYGEKIRAQLAEIAALRDLQVAQSVDYPTVDVRVDREKAGMSGVRPAEIASSLVAATSSSRFVVPNFWPDPKTGIGYQVQVQIPQSQIRSIGDLETLPIRREGGKQLLLGDVAQVKPGTAPGEFDRYNMRRQVSMTANIYGEDLGRMSRHVAQAIKRAGDPPKGADIDVRGQIPPMQQMFWGLGTGLVLAVVIIFLLLSANFQSLRLAFVTVSTVPAVVVGVSLALAVTGTTLNIQSFIGAIMAIGVAMANAILLVTFAEHHRLEGKDSVAAAVEGATGRLRPILMTSLAMTAGMLPLALALGEGGEQGAPLGRAVIGGLLAATFATLLILPSIFATVQSRAGTKSASLDPDDPDSAHYSPEAALPQKAPAALAGGPA